MITRNGGEAAAECAVAYDISIRQGTGQYSSPSATQPESVNAVRITDTTYTKTGGSTSSNYFQYASVRAVYEDGSTSPWNHTSWPSNNVATATCRFEEKDATHMNLYCTSLTTQSGQGGYRLKTFFDGIPDYNYQTVNMNPGAGWSVTIPSGTDRLVTSFPKGYLASGFHYYRIGNSFAIPYYK